MCLYIKSSKKKIAEKNIRCFKILAYDVNTKKYFAPNFYEYEYTSNGVNKNKLIHSLNTSDVYSGDVYKYICNIGLHTYRKYSDAISDNDYYNAISNRTVEYKVFECVIPRGSEYFSGAHEHNGLKKGFASAKLKLIKEIPTKKSNNETNS